MRNSTVFIIFWDLDIGGIQTLIKDLILYILKNRPDLTVEVLIKNTKDSHIINVLKASGFSNIHSPKIESIKNRYIRQLYFLIWIAFFYLKKNPIYCLTFLDTLSIYMILLKQCFFWKKTKIILNENILTSKNTQIYKTNIYFWNMCIKLLYPLSYLVIVPSEACKKDLIKTYNIAKSKIRVLYNWTLMEEVKRKTRKYDLIYLGRFEKEKNPTSLIYLTLMLKRKFPNITLRLVGKGSYQMKMEAIINKYNLSKNITFDGFRGDVDILLSDAKILVTTTQNEGIPLSMLEAGIQKTPCVSTVFEGVEEVILHNKTGYISNSLSEMALYITKLLRDPNLRNKFGLHAHKRILEKFSANAIDTFLSEIMPI